MLDVQPSSLEQLFLSPVGSGVMGESWRAGTSPLLFLLTRLQPERHSSPYWYIRLISGAHFNPVAKLSDAIAGTIVLDGCKRLHAKHKWKGAWYQAVL